jgi:hypothetical protein
MGDKSKKDKDKGQKQNVAKQKQKTERCLTETSQAVRVQPVLFSISNNFCALDSFFISASRFKALEGVEQIST